MYWRPYPEWYDRVTLPVLYRVPDSLNFLVKMRCQQLIIIDRFLARCGEVSYDEALRVRFFHLSLSGSVFT